MPGGEVPVGLGSTKGKSRESVLCREKARLPGPIFWGASARQTTSKKTRRCGDPHQRKSREKKRWKNKPFGGEGMGLIHNESEKAEGRQCRIAAEPRAKKISQERGDESNGRFPLQAREGGGSGPDRMEALENSRIQK